jgi:hypothetical protein
VCTYNIQTFNDKEVSLNTFLDRSSIVHILAVTEANHLRLGRDPAIQGFSYFGNSY